MLALLALGVLLTFARDRPDAFFTGVIEAPIWAGLMIVFQANSGRPAALGDTAR